MKKIFLKPTDFRSRGTETREKHRGVEDGNVHAHRSSYSFLCVPL